MRTFKFLLIALFGIYSLMLSAQEKRDVRLLFSNEMSFQGGFPGDMPKTYSYLYEVIPGIRLKNAFQVEVPVEIETKTDVAGDNVLSYDILMGLALGYHYQSKVFGTSEAKLFALSCLDHTEYAGWKWGGRINLFIDSSEQAYLFVGAGRYRQFKGGGVSGIVQAGIGIRLKRSL